MEHLGNLAVGGIPRFVSLRRRPRRCRRRTTERRKTETAAETTEASLAACLIELHVGHHQEVRNVVLLQALVPHQLGDLPHGSHEVSAATPIRSSQAAHLVHERGLAAQIVPLGIGRKGQDPSAERRMADLRGEDAERNRHVHRGPGHGA